MAEWKEIFVFVVGTSPQVITETIYALGISKPAVFPDEIYVITTATGKQIVINSIVKRDIIQELIKEYGFPHFNLPVNNILVPKYKNGQEIDDICSYEDNEIMGDLITSFIREKTSDPKNRLHCSIAGGRKTMSFYLGSALQLFGRPWDQLNHVIVTTEFESNPDFFYKPKENRKLSHRTKDGREILLNTKDAKIMLAELPFIRLGQKLPLKGNTFRELVYEGQKEIDFLSRQPEISVSLPERMLNIEGNIIYLSPMLMFFLVSFLRLKTETCPYRERPYCFDCKDCYKELGEIFGIENIMKNKSDLHKIFGSRILKSTEFINKWKNGIPAEICRQYISKLNNELSAAVKDDFLVSRVRVVSQKIYASSRYGIRIEKGKINIK